MNSKLRSRIIKLREEVPPEYTPCSIKPRILAVSSGKGGVGKTSITVNLSVALSMAGKKMIVFDGDLGMANVEILMGVSPSLTLLDCVKGNAGIKDILIPGPAGVKLVSGGAGFVEMAHLSDRMLKNIVDSLQILDGEADLIIVDTGAGISREVLAFIAAVEEVILVITPEPPSMTDAYSLAKIISQYKLHERINIIVNRVAGFKEANDTLQRFANVCNRFLHVSINYLGYVPEDSAVPGSIIAQEPLLLYNRSSPAARCLQKISMNLSNTDHIINSENNQGIREFAKKLVRLFRR